jgi:hypothetical protein
MVWGMALLSVEIAWTNGVIYFLESCEGEAVVVEPGAAFVSILEFSDPGAVTLEEAGPMFASVLLES